MKDKEQSNIKNISASVKAKLYSIAKANNKEFNLITRQYFQERFLFRLSKSKHFDKFILKGALLFMAYDISRNRPTQDIDFMGENINNDLIEITNIIKEIANIDYPDGVRFLQDKVKSERIKEDEDYEGVRVRIQCTLDTITYVLQLDIGFGDKIVNGPNKIEFPIILDFEPPILQVYSIESAIAEKFEAIVSLGLASSRMKDYYDILFFASHQSFSSKDISNALITTFKNRGTELIDFRYIFNDNFKKNVDLDLMWKAYIRKRKLTATLEFEIVVSKLEAFLLQCIISPNIDRRWNFTTFSWEA